MDNERHAIESKIVAGMGFEICEFKPDSDPCESCLAANRQLYFAGPTDSGTYWCLDCVLAAHEENERYGQDLLRIEALQKKGHTDHCGCRQVWGDGECECGRPLGGVT